MTGKEYLFLASSKNVTRRSFLLRKVNETFDTGRMQLFQ